MLNLFRKVFLAFYELVRFSKLYKLLNNYEFLNFFLVKYIKCLNFPMKNDKQPFQIVCVCVEEETTNKLFLFTT